MTELARPAAAEAAPLGHSDAFKTQAERRAELRRMRAIATMLLVLMAAIYLAMRRAPASWVWAPYLGAFAEAGMVGACADWFAVVALFRRPLGLPIPHTAVVPENKRRIGAAMGRFITNNFLSPRVAIARLASVDFVGLAARWLEDERNARAVAAAAGRAIPVRARPRAEGGDRRMGRVSPRGAGSRRSRRRRSPRAAYRSCGRRERARRCSTRRLDFVETTLERHKATIVRHVSQKTWRWIPKWVDDMIAAKVVNGLTETLREMRDPDHPWREQANALIEKLIDDLAHDPEMRAQGEALEAGHSRQSGIRRAGPGAVGGTGDGAEGRSASPRRSDCRSGSSRSAGALGRWLEEDAPRRARINRRLRLLALRTVLPRRAEIGAYIAAVVDNWDTATLVNRLELQVGKDLQYIRINGTLVGGLVGLLIFTLSRAFGG